MDTTENLKSSSPGEITDSIWSIIRPGRLTLHKIYAVNLTEKYIAELELRKIYNVTRVQLSVLRPVALGRPLRRDAHWVFI